MKDTATVPRNPADREPASPPVVDPELADQLLARAEAGGEAGSGVHGQQPGELERGDASQALPEQRTVCCPLAGIAGRPEAAGHDVADHASPAGAVSAAPPGQEVIMRGAFAAREPHRRAEDDAVRRVSQREPRRAHGAVGACGSCRCGDVQC